MSLSIDNPAGGIKFVLGVTGRTRRKSEVQSVLFDRRRWSVSQALDWLRKHGFRTPAADTSDGYLRFQQRSPDRYREFATIEPGRRNPLLETLAEGLAFGTGLGIASGVAVPVTLKTIERITGSEPQRNNLFFEYADAESAGRSAGQEYRSGTPGSGAAPAAAIAAAFNEWWSSEGESLAGKREKTKHRRAFEKGFRRGAKKNPFDEAAELSEAFHGRPAEEVTEYAETIEVHAHLTDLGELVELELADPPGVIIRFDPGVRLASNEHGTQLYIVGGDQSVDLEEFDVDPAKESVVLGTVAAVTYATAKFHLGEEDTIPGPYRHEFGEEGGELPALVYDTRNRLLSLHGGAYVIESDMDGGYSAGIRN